MSTTISSYGWNPLLSPTYTGWSAIANGVASASQTGLSSQAMTAMSAAQTNSSVLGSSALSGMSDALTISPNAYSLLYSADNNLSSAINNTNVPATNFFAQAQQLTNPLLPASSSDMVSLLTQAQNSSLENAAPSYFLNTFNPYSVLGPSTSNSSLGWLFNTVV